MHLLALTGGIASGKSTVAARLAEHGAVVVDADRLAREVVEPGTPALHAIAKRFGPSVIRTDGSLDRQALAGIVFSDEASRLSLNAITHPAVWARARELFALAEANDPGAVVVYDVPLLTEVAEGRPLKFDRVVVAHAPAETRISRLVELRGYSQADAAARVAAQASDADRLAVADVVIDTGGSLAQTLQQADELWQTVRGSGDADSHARHG
ncbi:dephospho-CoA kinase [Rathayibacter soli]|uniref:dephospho-CoA kinase n=1 Tax=Rathayibacter soli TaxID=3144168 RepID=UPI0027E47DBD|nr:dephospho-CoA kinase [Glaciibacter superstes]